MSNKYEISVWRDIKQTQKSLLKPGYNIEYYKEEKVGLIASDTIDIRYGAFNINLSEKINGEKTLTFDLPFLIRDNNNTFRNPFINLIPVESKIKLRDGDPVLNQLGVILTEENYTGKTKWYDFIIKNISENKEENVFSYEAVSSPLNELNKNGYHLEFDNELFNNQGTVTEIGEKIVKDTEWKIDTINSDFFQEKQEEVIYAMRIYNEDNYITPIRKSYKEELDDYTDSTELYDGYKIIKDEYIYVFYSSLTNKEKEFSFLYNSNNIYNIDDNHFIMNAYNYIPQLESYDTVKYITNENNYIDIQILDKNNKEKCYLKNTGVLFNKRGKKLISKPKGIIEPILSSPVQLYEKDDNIMECYSETEYINPTFTENLLNGTNNFSSDMIDTIWKSADTSNTSVSINTYPSIQKQSSYNMENIKPLSFLEVNFGDVKMEDNLDDTLLYNAYGNSYHSYLPKCVGRILNKSIAENIEKLGSLQTGDEFVLRMASGRSNTYYVENDTSHYKTTSEPIQLSYKEETLNDIIKGYAINCFGLIGKLSLYKEKDNGSYEIVKTLLKFSDRWYPEYIQNENGEYEPRIITFSESDTLSSKKEFKDRKFQYFYTKASVGQDINMSLEELQKYASSDGYNGLKIGFFLEDSLSKYYGKTLKSDSTNTKISLEQLYNQNYYSGTNKCNTFAIADMDFFRKTNIIDKNTNNNIKQPANFIDKNNISDNVEDYKFIKPGEIQSNINTNLITEKFYLFPLLEDRIGTAKNWTTKEDIFNSEYTIKFPNNLYKNPIENGYKLIYTSDCEKIRSIEKSKTTCMDLIQTLNENFECWSDFQVFHNLETGEIITEEILQNKLINGEYQEIPIIRQKKNIVFKKYIGKPNFAGFKYTINLDNIERNVISSEIVTKLIVDDNENEYGLNGFCSINRASENPTQTNFILNFDYYINQGLIDEEELQKDLYENTSDKKGYYTILKELNKNKNQYSDMLSENIVNLSVVKSKKDLAQLNKDAANEKIAETIKDLISITNGEISEEKDIPNYITKHGLNDSSNATYYINMYNVYKAQFLNNSRLLGDPEYDLDGVTIKKDSNGFEIYKENKETYGYQYYSLQLKNIELNNKLSQISTEIEELNNSFFNKYKSFIQEGTWSSEDFFDDNLYYYTAAAVMYTSSFPQIEYNIRVVDLSDIEEYKNYYFEIGDKTFIEDTEFFGYTTKNGIKTPYQEEVVISEIIHHIDTNEPDEITIQNYKTQFEDLFQRISATIQTVELNDGKITKIASMITSDGKITEDTLQSSLNGTALVITNANNDTVVWDDTGINLSQPGSSLAVRLTNGQILLSNNGGFTWNQAISGNGITTNLLTAGTINVGDIIIKDGDTPAFIWDKNGLNAYSTTNNGELSVGDFVRFDKYGLYGILNGNYSTSSPFIPSSTKDIEDASLFSLTWNGFSIKSKHEEGTGRIKISPTEDIQVLEDNYNGETIERIKIGLLDTKETSEINQGHWIGEQTSFNSENNRVGIYGMRINDVNGNTVLETNSIGQLWLKDKMMIGPDRYNPRVQLGAIELLTDELNREYSKIFSVKNFENQETISFFDNGLLKASNVELTGNITATSGTFHGRIEAEEGYIGEITNDNTGQLISGVIIDKNGLHSANYSQENNSGFNITTNGEMYINNLEIGQNAISKYIKLGNGYILNPNNYKRYFILGGSNINNLPETIQSLNQNQVDDLNIPLAIRDNGLVNFGNILIDGNTSIMRGTNWELNPTTSIFNNIVASGIIKGSVFEKNSTRVSGGVMLFKDGAIIESIATIEKEIEGVKKQVSEIVLSIDSNSNTLIQNNLFNLNDYIYIQSDNNENNLYSQIIEVNEQKHSIVIQDKISNTLSGIIIRLGTTKEWIIGINSTETTSSTNLYGNSLTFNSFDIINNNIKYTPQIVLGNLKEVINKDKIGLYSKNVYLTGQITTQLDAYDKYSGINTNSSILFNKKFNNKLIFDDNSPIIYWSGAKSDLPADIQESNFQITSNGTIYAQNGFFEGSLITRAVLDASEIKTAKIVGTGETPALTIEDTDIGIDFKSKTKDSIFKVTTTKIDTSVKINSNNIISINKNNNSLILSESYINLQNANSLYSFNLKDNLELNVNNNKIISISQNNINIDKTTVFNNQMIQKYGDKGKLTYYTKNNELLGYNLYIYE